MSSKPPLTIISGGQTGVDRAALDVALALGLDCGGRCTRGRRAEDGTIPKRYPLRETESVDYPVRTRRNVRDSDATLILTRGKPDRGTALTLAIATKFEKPYLVVDLNGPVQVKQIRQWLTSHQVRILNVAGPRESSQLGIQEQTTRLLQRLLTPLTRPRRKVAKKLHSQKRELKP